MALALEAAVVLAGELELLEGRAHAAVEDDDALARRGEEVSCYRCAGSSCSPPSVPAVAPCLAPGSSAVAAASQVRVPQPLWMVEHRIATRRVATSPRCTLRGRPRSRPTGCSRTGAADSARRRMSYQVMPSRTSAGRPSADRGRDLDRLEDHAVGERVGLADPEAGRQDADHGELEDADVGRRRRDDGGDVDREQHRCGAADPDRRRSRPERGERARSRRGAGAPRRRAAGSAASGPRRGSRKTVRPRADLDQRVADRARRPGRSGRSRRCADQRRARGRPRRAAAAAPS